MILYRQKNNFKIDGERRIIENTKLSTAKKQGAKEREKSIAKSMLTKKMDIPLISELTGLSKNQITMLMQKKFKY